MTEKHAAWPTVEGYFNLIVSLALQLDTAARRECKFDYSCRFQINYHLKHSDGSGRWNFKKKRCKWKAGARMPAIANFLVTFMPSIEIDFYKYTKVQHSSNLPVNCMCPVAIQLVLTDVPLAPPCCSHLTFAEDV